MKKCRKCKGVMYEFLVQTLQSEKEGYICESCGNWTYRKKKYIGSVV